MTTKEARMTTKQVADSIVKLCKEGKFDECLEKFYSPDIVSVEAGAPPGQSREMKGIEAVKGKAKWWAENHEVHSAVVEGPLVAGPYFSVMYKMDLTFKPEKRRFSMEEIALYKVVDGRIVHEEFFYSM